MSFCGNVTANNNSTSVVGNDLNSIPVKDVIIVAFMLSLWLYSIMLIVRAWSKIHNLPGETGSLFAFWHHFPLGHSFSSISLCLAIREDQGNKWKALSIKRNRRQQGKIWRCVSFFCHSFACRVCAQLRRQYVAFRHDVLEEQEERRKRRGRGARRRRRRRRKWGWVFFITLTFHKGEGKNITYNWALTLIKCMIVIAFFPSGGKWSLSRGSSCHRERDVFSGDTFSY